MTSANSFSGKGRTNKTNGGGVTPPSKPVGSFLITPCLAKRARKIYLIIIARDLLQPSYVMDETPEN
jgi:hypothetical protein